jgi:acyl dehydratase
VSGPLPETGAPLPEIRLGPIDMAQTQRYAAAALDPNPLHSDAGAARDAGLDAPVVHGMLLMGQFERTVVAWRADMHITRLAATFLRPIHVGSRISLGGRVAKVTRDSHGADVVLRLFVRTERSEIACIGEAFGRI